MLLRLILILGLLNSYYATYAQENESRSVMSVMCSCLYRVFDVNNYLMYPEDIESPRLFQRFREYSVRPFSEFESSAKGSQEACKDEDAQEDAEVTQ